MKPIRILIVDDHQLIAESIAAFQEKDKNIYVAGIVSNGYEVLTKLPFNTVDVVLMDIKLPGVSGVESTRFIHERYSEIKILALSIFDNKELIVEMIRAGASGFLLKSNASDELQCAIRTLGKGGHYFSKEVREHISSSSISNSGVIKDLENGAYGKYLSA